MEITNAVYSNADKSSISATVDGVPMSVPVCPGNRHYDAIIEQAVSIADYVAPAVDTAALRRQALAGLGELVEQITRRKLLGQDTILSEAKLRSEQDAIDLAYPESSSSSSSTSSSSLVEPDFVPADQL